MKMGTRIYGFILIGEPGVHDHSVYRFNPKTETFADRYHHNENDYGKGEWKTTVKKMVDGKWTPVDAIVKENGRRRAE
jgi:hypothetical protein